MASKLDKDDYVYDVENLSALMASMDADGTEPGARPKKSKRLVEKTAGKSTKAQPPPASSIESHLELEKVKNQNLKMELEITKAQLELAKMKSVCRTADPFFRTATPVTGRYHFHSWKRPRITHPDVRTTLGKEETWVNPPKQLCLLV